MRNNEEDGRRQDELSKWLRAEPKSVIAGDFNLHSEVWSRLGRRDEEADELVEWCDTNDFVILNTGVDTKVDRNRGTGSAPDITIVHSSLVERCSWKVTKEMGSDHNLTITTISCKREGRQESAKYTWQWRKVDWEKFVKKVEESCCDWVQWLLLRELTSQTLCHLLCYIIIALLLILEAVLTLSAMHDLDLEPTKEEHTEVIQDLRVRKAPGEEWHANPSRSSGRKYRHLPSTPPWISNQMLEQWRGPSWHEKCKNRDSL